MNNIIGMDLESWRIITVIGTLGAVLLYAYRISCLINLMRSESERLAGNNRLIYAGLILFIPLGIGAWLYDFVVNEKNFSPLFLFPFSIVLAMFVYTMFHLLPVATQFNFDYMKW